MNESEIQLLNHLDRPVTIVGIDVLELIIFGGFFSFGILKKSMFIGFIVGVALVFALRRLKKSEQEASVAAKIYWHMPTMFTSLKLKAPSYIREWIA